MSYYLFSLHFIFMIRNSRVPSMVLKSAGRSGHVAQVWRKSDLFLNSHSNLELLATFNRSKYLIHCLQCAERSLLAKANISSTTHVQLLQWLHGEQQRHKQSKRNISLTLRNMKENFASQNDCFKKVCSETKDLL